MNFFNTDNFLWRCFNKLADFVLLSCIWLLCCIPVVTIVPACIALYDATARCVYGPEGGTYGRFFRTFKNELHRGIPMTLLWALIGFLLNAGDQVLCRLAAGSNSWTVFSIVYFCTLLIPIGTGCWAISLESRFAYSFSVLHRNAFIFTFAHLPQTIAIVALFVLALTVCINIAPLVVVIPGFLAYLQAVFAERVLKRYMPKPTEE